MITTNTAINLLYDNLNLIVLLFSDDIIETSTVASQASNATWRQGRQLLRQYVI